jgi:hypothetical protein
MTEKKTTDIEKADAKIEEEKPVDSGRRELLAKGYSAAVLGLVFGGAARLTACKDDKKSDDEGDTDTGACEPNTLCSDTCTYANDGACDDGGDGSSYSVCELGSDCTDCGTRYVDCSDGYSNVYSDGYSNGYSNSYSNYYNYYSNYYYNYYSNYYSNYGNFDNSW